MTGLIKCKEEEVETIIYEVCEKDREIHQGRKWALFETRSINRNHHDETNNNKAEARINNWSTGMIAAQICCLVGQAFAGQGAAGAIFSAGAHGFDINQCINLENAINQKLMAMITIIKWWEA